MREFTAIQPETVFFHNLLNSLALIPALTQIYGSWYEYFLADI
jgi:hypothetical protein